MKNQREINRILTYFTQFTINMLVPIFLCSFAGYYIDGKLGTECFFVILFFVGALAGFRNIYIMVKKNIRDPKD
ncbi:MAG: AtpZ/AtpI family protein [Lachnospiraceae bacterium]|nr:AtpZ/AtpI family protein [Lachnospiraceae bacterium]